MPKKRERIFGASELVDWQGDCITSKQENRNEFCGYDSGKIVGMHRFRTSDRQRLGGHRQRFYELDAAARNGMHEDE